MSIDLTKPSRELDLLVHEKVMGADMEQVWLDLGSDSIYSLYGRALVPCYSEQIWDAWIVVGKLDGEWKLQGHEGLGWEAGFYSSTGGMDAVIVSVEAMAYSAPLAICIAALKAVGALPTE